jgi:hypothetical protein
VNIFSPVNSKLCYGNHFKSVSEAENGDECLNKMDDHTLDVGIICKFVLPTLSKNFSLGRSINGVYVYYRGHPVML